MNNYSQIVNIEINAIGSNVRQFEANLSLSLPPNGCSFICQVLKRKEKWVN
jgi:hypothetical protein